MKTTLDIVIPTYNEADIIISTTTKLLDFCSEQLNGYQYRIVIADNASTDSTADIASSAFLGMNEVLILRLKEKGRGKALMSAWGESKVDICAYMDADLSTDLKHLPAIVDKIRDGGFDIAVGTRHASGSVVNRGFKRRLIGNLHVLLMKVIVGISFSDPYCGFKAASRKAIDLIFPHIDPAKWRVNGNAWFWDTEFLVIGERLGLKIYEEPVNWKDDSTSTARIFNDSVESIKGMLRLRKEKPWLSKKKAMLYPFQTKAH